jgi:predicted nucleic acid-binding protein
MPSFVAVLDACVLFSAALRDTLLRAANVGLYRIQWSDEILDEVRRNLISDRNIPPEKVQRLIDMMRKHFPEASVTHHTSLIGVMPNDPKDRHVLAVAIACRAQVIVTHNLRHFPGELLTPFEVEAQSPDEFLIHLFHLNPSRMIEIVEGQARDLRNPPLTVSDVLTILAQDAPRFADLVRQQGGYYE